jgi:hypothetical protein
MASGLGTPTGTALAASLCALANPPVPPAAPVIVSPTPKAARTVAPAKVTGAHFANVLKGKPRLSFAVSAREGAKLTSLSISRRPRPPARSGSN